MKITILGSGTILSTQTRNPAGYLLNHGKDTALLDAGPGILKQLKIYEIDLISIKTVFLTHFHLDHCADIFPLLMNRHLLVEKSNADLILIGPEGLKEWYHKISSTQGLWLQVNPPLLIEIQDKPLEWAGYKVVTHKAYHTEQSVSYRFSGTKDIFFSGDTGFDKNLIQFAKNCHLAFLECSLPDDQQIEGHLTASQSGRFAELASFDHLILTHLYPSNDTPDLNKRVSRFFPGKITIAADFMEIDI